MDGLTQPCGFHLGLDLGVDVRTVAHDFIQDGIIDKMRQTTPNLIYIVDDEIDITRLISRHLVASGYQTKVFNDGDSVVNSLRQDLPALIILDILMPGINGLELAADIRRISQAAILMLSVVADPLTKSEALNLGADDYLTKPFQSEELISRVRAILRRPRGPGIGTTPSSTHFSSGELDIDLERLQVESHGRLVELTPMEWAVLSVLVRNAGRVVTPQQILQDVWQQEHALEDPYVRIYINRLRKKLEPDPQQPRYILLARRLGYRLIEGD